ncbi:22937_t:CDS:2, partial [Entrophospora sp. SA101]
MSQNINYCQVLDCESNKDIRTFTPGAKKKSEEKETLTMYNYLNIDIKVDMANDKPNLTKDIFDLLLQKISNMESESNVYRNNQISKSNKF